MSDQPSPRPNGNGVLRRLSSVPASVWGVLLTQFIALTIWAVRLDAKVNAISEIVRDLQEHDTFPGRLLQQRVDRDETIVKKISDDLKLMIERIDRMETPLAKKVDALERTMGIVNDRANTLNDRVNSVATRLDQITRDIQRNEERQTKIIEALDAQYNALNDHLRTHGGNSVQPQRPRR